MKAQYTPGPWTLQAGRSFKTVSGDFYLNYGSDKHGNPNFKDFSELDRNAELIAAAPELLEALENLLTELHQHYKMNVKKHFSLLVADAAARTAIRKAKGAP